MFIEKTSQNPDTELVLTGYFNQYVVHWESDHLIFCTRQGKNKKLIEFMTDFNLVQLLCRGTLTYHLSKSESSTIDLVFTSGWLVQT